MENGIRVLLLAASLIALSGCATVGSWLHQREDARQAEQESQRQLAADPEAAPDDNSPPPRVVEPEVERRKLTVPKIKASNIEVGVNYGALSIEDFGTNPVYGGTLSYHVTEDFFMRAGIGRSTAGKTSFETLSQIQLLNNANRHFTYYDLTLGYNFLPGEAFLGRGIALGTSFYLLGGIGGTNFAGDTKFTVNFGGGYQVLPSDWIAVHIEVLDRVFQSSLLGSSKLTNNLEASIGASVYF
jgi:outer membrane beta-barrel protein